MKNITGEKKKSKQKHLSCLKEIVNIQKLTDIPIVVVIFKPPLQEWKHNGKFRSAVPCFMLLRISLFLKIITGY